MSETTFIFDFDGTIADSFHRTVEISNKLSEEFNSNKIKPHEIEVLKDKTSRQVEQYYPAIT